MKFKIGDKVKIIKVSGGACQERIDLKKNGNAGLVRSVDTGNIYEYYVEFSEDMILWCKEEEIELADPTQSDSELLQQLKDLTEKAKRVDELEAELKALKESRIRHGLIVEDLGTYCTSIIGSSHKEEEVQEGNREEIMGIISSAIRSHFDTSEDLILQEFSATEDEDDDTIEFKIIIESMGFPEDEDEETEGDEA